MKSRAYDEAWVLEMLGAYGCTKAEIEAAIFVLEALIEHDVKIDKDLPNLLRMSSELRQKDAEHKRSPFPIIDE